MPTLREFFTAEANEFLAELNAVAQRLEKGAATPAELQKHSRSLRGSAQIAREERVYRAAAALETAARSLAAGALGWSEEISARLHRTLEDLEALVRGAESEEDADTRVKRSLDRWREVGVAMPGEQTQPASQVSEASRQFRQFAAHEAAGIIAEMDIGIEALAADARSRDPLKAILRRERALLGAARLDEIGPVAEALRATEDITRVIAKLNTPVKDEWLNVFRAARDVLKASLEALRNGEAPVATPALSKLRVLRQELLDRYGQGEPLNASTGAPAPTGTYMAPAQTAAPAPVSASAPPAAAPAQTEVAAEEAVGIETLVYSRDRALKRALELQPQLAALAQQLPAARDTVDKLFDLICLGAS